MPISLFLYTQTMIKKDKIRNTFMILYFIMVMAVTWTANNSYYMADIYFSSILSISIVMLVLTFYIFDLKYVKIWFNERWFQAKINARKRREIKELIDKKYEK